MSNVELNYMEIGLNSQSGISGTRVNGLTLKQLNIHDNADATSGGGLFESGINLYEFSGTAQGGSNPTIFDEIRVDNSHEYDVYILNSTTTLLDLQVISSTFTNDGTSTQADGQFYLVISNSAQATLNVSDSVFDGNKVTGFKTGNGVYVEANNSGSITATVSGSTFKENALPGLAAVASNSGKAVFNFSNNRVEKNETDSITVFIDTSANASAKIISNTVGLTGTSGSGSDTGYGIRTSNAGDGTLTLLLQGNIVQETADVGGLYVVQAIAAGAIEATLLNNRFTNIGDNDNSDYPIIVQTIVPLTTICADISGNSFTGVNPASVDIRVRGLNGVVNVLQSSELALSAANNSATISTYGNVNYSGAACTQP